MESRPTSSGRRSTSAPPPAFATPRARPAIRRARSTRTARPCCTPTRAALPDTLNLSARDVVLPVVPMFHVNAWGLPYSCALAGAKLVFPGPHLDGKSLHELFEAEGVTMSAGVPTVWLGLLNYMKEKKLRFSTPEARGDRRLGLPAGDDPRLPGRVRRAGAARLGHDRDEPARHRRHAQGEAGEARQGGARRAAGQAGPRASSASTCGSSTRTASELPWDGKAFGDLQVRGPWVIKSYFKGEGGDPLQDDEGPAGSRPATWRTIDPEGYMQITDRSKDVIKSGGEWISSIDLENIAMAHPAIAEAAVIGVPHPKWDERPIVVAVKKPGQEVSKDELLQLLRGQDRQVVDARRRGVRARAAAHRHRQALQAHAAPADSRTTALIQERETSRTGSRASRFDRARQEERDHRARCTPMLGKRARRRGRRPAGARRAAARRRRLLHRRQRRRRLPEAPRTPGTLAGARAVRRAAEHEQAGGRRGRRPGGRHRHDHAAALRPRLRGAERALPAAVRAAGHRAGVRLDLPAAAARRLPARRRAAAPRPAVHRAEGATRPASSRRSLPQEQLLGEAQKAADRAGRAAAGIDPPHQAADEGALRPTRSPRRSTRRRASSASGCPRPRRRRR